MGIEGMKELPDVSFIDNLSLEEVKNILMEEYKKEYENITGNEPVMERSDPIRLLISSQATTTLELTIRGNTRYNETDTVRIRGLYRLSGKYFIDQVIHDIDADSGFTTKLTMHKVQKRVTK